MQLLQGTFFNSFNNFRAYYHFKEVKLVIIIKNEENVDILPFEGMYLYLSWLPGFILHPIWYCFTWRDKTVFITVNLDIV